MADTAVIDAMRGVEQSTASLLVMAISIGNGEEQSTAPLGADTATSGLPRTQLESSSAAKSHRNIPYPNELSRPAAPRSSAVSVMASRTSTAEAEGNMPIKAPAQAATWGVAIDVPLQEA